MHLSNAYDSDLNHDETNYSYFTNMISSLFGQIDFDKDEEDKFDMMTKG